MHDVIGIGMIQHERYDTMGASAVFNGMAWAQKHGAWR